MDFNLGDARSITSIPRNHDYSSSDHILETNNPCPNNNLLLLLRTIHQYILFLLGSLVSRFISLAQSFHLPWKYTSSYLRSRTTSSVDTIP